MLSKRLEYGYILLKKLKTEKYNELKSGKDLLSDGEVPYNMGLNILTTLVKKGLVLSKKGKMGGFTIVNPEVTMLDLFIALESEEYENISKSKYIDSSYENIMQDLGKILLKELGYIKID